MFSLEIKVHPFELQKDRRVLLTVLTLRSKSSFLTIRLDTANFDNGDSRSINLAKFTIFWVVLKAGMPESRNAGKPECRNAGMPEIKTRKS